MSESKFELIGEDMMVEVVVKVGQNLKAVLRLRCVSKLWQRLVNSRYLHTLTCNDPLELKGHLMKIEFGNMFQIKYPPVLAYTAHRCQRDNNHFGQEEEGWPLLEKIDDTGLVFLDACNGLLLHRLISSSNNNNASSPPVYRVSNLETSTSVVVIGEPDTADSRYNKMDHAVLAYDPAESLMSFKIIAYFRRLTPPGNSLRHKCMRIYASKTGKWSRDLNFDHHLPHGLGTRWVQQSVYLNGAIYRLTIIGYLLRFEVTDDENYDDRRAQAIQIPKGIWSFSITPVHVGNNKGQINLALPINSCGDLKIWVLQEEGHGSNYSYQWILKHDIRNLKIPSGLVRNMGRTLIRPLGFHPYEDALVLFAVNDFQFRFVSFAGILTGISAFLLIMVLYMTHFHERLLFGPAPSHSSPVRYHFNENERWVL